MDNLESQTEKPRSVMSTTKKPMRGDALRKSGPSGDASESRSTRVHVGIGFDPRLLAGLRNARAALNRPPAEQSAAMVEFLGDSLGSISLNQLIEIGAAAVLSELERMNGGPFPDAS